MDLGLADRVYVVTGGSRGLGLATAQVLVAEGARVVLAARTPEGVLAAAAALGGESVAVGVPINLADPDAAAELVAVAHGRFGRLDGGLLSTGGPPGATAVGATDDAWRQTFESDFLGVVRVAREIASRVDRGGSLAFVLSSSVRSPISGLALSNGMRPGLAMIAKTMADELGSRGVRVNGVLPGRIRTARIDAMDAAAGPAAAEAARAAIPLGRYGEPDEFGRVAAFVLSPAASYVTGAMLSVDGGAARGL